MVPGKDPSRSTIPQQRTRASGVIRHRGPDGTRPYNATLNIFPHKKPFWYRIQHIRLVMKNTHVKILTDSVHENEETLLRVILENSPSR
jgi:hypothetical protein